MGAPTPQFIPAPFASGSSDVNFPIPSAPPASPANAASWQGGFPAITMQTEVSGGLAPLGQDFNGILLTVTQAIYALQAGQPYGFNASFEGLIAGYNVGSLLAMADGSGLWLNASAANSTNPDTDVSAVGWVPGISYGITSVGSLVGGTVTLAPSQTRRAVIRLAGTLASNLIVIVPNTLQQWLIVNNTTGAFSTTVKTAAGSGVVVPQGGPSQPTGIWGDGTNVYVTQAPLSTPIAQAATPTTLCERDNTGAGFFTRVNLSSPANENPTIGSVLVQSSANDGLSRWATLAYLFTSTTFAGVPTAPTAAVGTRTAQLATTTFANPGGVLGAGHGAAGWRKNADGTIEQWGSFNYGGSGSPVSFPFQVGAGAFTSAVYYISFTTYSGGFNPGWDTSGTTLADGSAAMGGLGGYSGPVYWRALGK